MCCAELFLFSEASASFDKGTIEDRDWISENVDIRVEYQDSKNSPRPGMLTIHEYLKNTLAASSAAIVFYDHTTGELADYITFTRSSDELSS
jgi:hypothetical protein